MKHQRCDLLVHFQNPGRFPGKKKSHVRKHWTQGTRSGNVRGELPIQEETKDDWSFFVVYVWHIWMPVENRPKMPEINSEPCNSLSVGRCFNRFCHNVGPFHSVNHFILIATTSSVSSSLFESCGLGGWRLGVKIREGEGSVHNSFLAGLLWRKATQTH